MVWKRKIARWMSNPLLQYIMRLYVSIMIPRQRIGVSLVVFNQENKILLLEHVFHPKSPWGLPSGWLKRRESPVAGALRELKEETGLEAEIGPTLWIDNGPDTAFIGIIFSAEAVPGDIRLSTEILSYAWVDCDELPWGMNAEVYTAVTRAQKLRLLRKSAKDIG